MNVSKGELNMKMKNDIIETYKGCIIQHGKMNDRIYLMKILETAENPVTDIINLADKKGYSKIIAKIPELKKQKFLNNGFIEEAEIPSFYSDNSSASFMGFYIDKKRRVEDKIDVIEKNLSIAIEKGKDAKKSELDNKFTIRECTTSDTEEMAEIYRKVFPTYPFPIHKSEYLEETMKTHIDYYCVETDNVMVALSSSEKDIKELNVEMTDFATLPEWRGYGFGQALLSIMEKNMKEKDFKTSYTIARAMSAGMNIVFSRAGYEYGGRLINNTNISGNIESMNIWYKPLG